MDQADSGRAREAGRHRARRRRAAPGRLTPRPGTAARDGPARAGRRLNRVAVCRSRADPRSCTPLRRTPGSRPPPCPPPPRCPRTPHAAPGYGGSRRPCPGWTTTQPRRCLPIEGRPAPVHTASPDTLDSARAALGPLLPVFAPGEPSVAVRPVAEDVGRRGPFGRRVGPLVRARRVRGGGPARTIGLEVAGRFTGTGHRGGTLLTARLDALRTPSGSAERAQGAPPASGRAAGSGRGEARRGASGPGRTCGT